LHMTSTGLVVGYQAVDGATQRTGLIDNAAAGIFEQLRIDTKPQKQGHRRFLSACCPMPRALITGPWRAGPGRAIPAGGGGVERPWRRPLPLGSEGKKNSLRPGWEDCGTEFRPGRYFCPAARKLVAKAGGPGHARPNKGMERRPFWAFQGADFF